MSDEVVINLQSTRPLVSEGNHVHTCPECYEHVPCGMTCAVEPDMTLDDGTLRGAHDVCDRCRDHARCGQVYPVWVALGWVQWQGSAQRERLMSIEYHRCEAEGVRAERNGFVGTLCKEHEKGRSK